MRPCGDFSHLRRNHSWTCPRGHAVRHRDQREIGPFSRWCAGIPFSMSISNSETLLHAPPPTTTQPTLEDPTDIKAARAQRHVLANQSLGSAASALRSNPFPAPPTPGDVTSAFEKLNPQTGDNPSAAGTGSSPRARRLASFGAARTCRGRLAPAEAKREQLGVCGSDGGRTEWAWGQKAVQEIPHFEQAVN